MTASNARDIVDRYFAAMAKKDFAAMRPLLHDDVIFRGVLGATDGPQDYIDGLRQTLAKVREVRRLAIAAEGEHVFQVYEQIFDEPAITVPVVQWLQIRDGRIASLRVYFDPRPLLAGRP
jgi:ketosteroid isomerase-like protein